MLEKAAHLLKSSHRIVSLLGAGASVPSGIPDFRGAQGLYTLNAQVEEVLSASFFALYPESFYKFYKDNLLFPAAQPNPIHTTLAKWEAQGILKACLTQNIDGLEEKAGLTNVFQLHGTVTRNFCTKCGSIFDLAYIMSHGNPVPYCSLCHALIKPDVVLYGESLDLSLWEKARRAVRHADLLLVIGTSLRVYPVAGLLNELSFPRQKLIIINKDHTPFDGEADIVLRMPAEQVLPAIDLLFSNK